MGKLEKDRLSLCGIDHGCGHRIIPGSPQRLIGWPSCSLKDIPTLLGRGMGSAPYPIPESNWTAPKVLSPPFDWDGIREPMYF